MTNRISLLGPRGNTISVVAAGQGPVLMLLHGFPLDHRMWTAQLEQLSRSYHVIAPEFRGFGQSTFAETIDGETQYTMADLADDVEVVRAHLATGQKVALCGLSMGGYVAFEYWQRHVAHLSHLILANTKPNADEPSGQAARIAMAERALLEGTWPAVSAMLPKLLPAGLSENQPEVYAIVETMMRSTPPQAVADAQTAMAQRRDFVPALGDIQVPTLVLTGELDSIAPPAETLDWASKIPGCTSVVLPGVGHLSPLEAPDAFNQAIDRFCRFES